MQRSIYTTACCMCAGGRICSICMRMCICSVACAHAYAGRICSRPSDSSLHTWRASPERWCSRNPACLSKCPLARSSPGGHPPLLRPSCLLRAAPLGSRGGPSLLRGRREAPGVLWCLPSRQSHRLWPYQEGGGRAPRVGGGVAADHREGGRVRGHVELEQSWRVECCTLDVLGL